MKKTILLLLFSITAFSQDFGTIEKLQSSTLPAIKELTNSLVNSGTQKFQFLKEKESQEYYLLVYVPVGLTAVQIEESRVNRYDNGVIFRLTKNQDETYKLREFFAEPSVMYSIVEKVFYPKITLEDFTSKAGYRDFIKTDKKIRFYFYTGESKYRFYQY
ncbi:MAG: hypothetical protein K2P85_13485 [Flavobacteriaceae bacterium]|nr:hypothetical protein [Flavobacteriaceae bacterium]